MLILWDTETWRQVCSLASHALTVTQMAFDHGGQRLLSVSRDRCWSVFKRKRESDEGESKVVSVFLKVRTIRYCYYRYPLFLEGTECLSVECLSGPLLQLVARSDKSRQHARIIWSCAWSGDDKYFATASRDKKVLYIFTYLPLKSHIQY